MAKPPTKIPLTCGACGGATGKNIEIKSIPDPKTGRVETSYRWERCGACGGKGIINQ